ncbi:MAG TPA: adenylate/guanylate cyclase domain-containing protein [Methylomirabilota bacterium]|nr:adenylate/guanylate cyclase domain-containing protein [Methylomirabilota bacterium]
MKCPRCQHDNPPSARFCNDCGALFELTCSACHQANPAGSRFCNGCGRALGIAPATAPRYASPESYTPKHLAEKILTSKAALEGERKQVTVLFADLKGSMELLADRDPEEARKLLDPVLERMMEAVHRYEGTVNQVMGDGIMALFGAPLAHEDHAVRACYAALRMQESVKKYAEEVRRSHAAVVKIRVGLNSGEVVVRAIGSDLHMDYTAVGQTTHLAARMEQLADPGAIVITPATLALAEGYVEVKSLGPVPVKGLPEPVEVYEVTGAGAARTRLQAAARRGLTRFVGRDAELEQLRRAQQLAGDGHGQVAAVVGEAGVGKSRLIYELTHSHRLHGWLVLESASVSYGKATSYLPVIDLLKGYFKIQDRDDLREIREKVTGKLLTLDRALEPTLPALLALLDVPVDDAAWPTLDPAQRRQQTLDAVKRLLLREAREQPLLLIFEDLHWIDGETQAVLDALVDSLGSARLLLLVNYRPEYQHAWGSKTSYSQFRLDALPAESAGELLEALLGDDPGLEPLKQLLVKRGNPFFLEETVRTLVETKALAGERGRYRLTQPIQAIQVPATVQAMLAARIDRLAPEDKRLLQTASVVGKDVPWVLLQAIADFPDEALRSGLDHLQAAEFLYEASLFPDLEYTFKHALTHEVTYASLLHDRRRSLHARIAEAIETAWAGRLGDQVERLAHHAGRGELWDKALGYLEQAGAKSFGRSAHREAVACYEQALDVLRHLPESAGTQRKAIDVRIALRNSLFPLGQLTRIIDLLDEAEALAAAIGDRERLALVLSRRAHYFWSVGEPRAGLEAGQRALSIAVQLDSLPLKVAASYFLGQLHHARGDYVAAIEILEQVVAWLPDELAFDRLGMAAPPSVFARTWLAFSRAETGAFAEALAQGAEALRIAEALDHPYGLYHGHLAVGTVRSLKGDVELAMPALERALRIAAESSMPAMGRPTAAQLGSVYGLIGRVEEATAVLEDGLGEAVHRWDAFLPLNVFALAQVYLLGGRIVEAEQAATRALELAQRQEQRGNEARAMWVLGEIAARSAPAEAEGRYRSALALAGELGMRPLVAHCHLGLAKLYRRTGKRQEAQEHLTTATTMYREMDMRFWLEKTGTELKALD